MSYFVTGATGFIGRHLVDHLLEHGEKVFVLVRPESMQKFEELRARWGNDPSRVVPIEGDLVLEGSGLGEAVRAQLGGPVKHFFHLAAIHDISCRDEEAQARTNVTGTRNALRLAQELGAGCFHHMSSCGVAGRYDGLWHEEMLEEWGGSDLACDRTKHEAEKLVRSECPVPFRIYRPSTVVGHSESGEASKIHGPYFLFRAIQALREALPRWLPLPYVAAGPQNLVPVDYVVRAIDHLAHRKGLDGRCFQLTDPEHCELQDLLNAIARAARAPEFRFKLDARVIDLLAEGVPEETFRLFAPRDTIANAFLDAYGIPQVFLERARFPTRFNGANTLKELEGTDIECPPFDSYVWKLWRYWEQHLDPDRPGARELSDIVKDRVVMVTGASSGIGRATAIRFATAGARVLLVARSTDKLEDVRREIEANGGAATVYTADLSDMDQCRSLIPKVLEAHGGVDALINNAGRSIARSIADSSDRLHDFQRSMAINYFGPIALMLGFLPGMRERKFGYVVNVLSAGAQMHTPLSAAYSSSKAALDTASNSIRGEVSYDNVFVSNIYMGLVHTPMSSDTLTFDNMQGLTPEQAADQIADAIVHERVTDSGEGAGVILRFLWAIWPKGASITTGAMYRALAESGFRIPRRDDDSQ